MKPSIQCMDPSLPPSCSCSCSNGITFNQTLSVNLDEEERAHTTKLEKILTARQTELVNELETTKQALEVARNNHTACVEEWNEKPFTYLGCYENSASNRLSDLAVTDGLMTIPRCAKICQSFRYYGLEYGSRCFCGNTWKSSPAVEPSKCNWKCEGDHKTMCGGNGNTGFYQKMI